MLRLFYNFARHLLRFRSPLRPPGALAEREFLGKCIKCNQCAQVCPYGSIRMAHLEWGEHYGTPLIFPRAIPCYLCMKCPPVCPSGALDNSLSDKTRVRMGLAVIDESQCLPYQGVICRACFERCPIHREAILLEKELLPKVVRDKCTGCGVCENVCPVDEPAITVVTPRAITALKSDFDVSFFPLPRPMVAGRSVRQRQPSPRKQSIAGLP